MVDEKIMTKFMSCCDVVEVCLREYMKEKFKFTILMQGAASSKNVSWQAFYCSQGSRKY